MNLYLETIQKFYPDVMVRQIGSDTSYETIEWIVGAPISQQELDLKVLDFVRDDIKSKINTIREEKLVMGVRFIGYTWDSDQRARENINGMTNAIQTGFYTATTVQWRSQENVNVDFSVSDFIALSLKIMNYISLVYKASWDMKDGLNSITDLNILLNYDVSVGWPSNE